MSVNDDLPLPIDKLPECWFDDSRMNALFAPFRNKNVNSEDSNSKINFWKKIIRSWCMEKNVCSFQLADLKKAFKRKGCAPGCLEPILEELYLIGDLQIYNEFIKVPQQSWTGWAFDTFVRRPAYWSLNKVKDSIYTPDKNMIFINIDVVNNLSNKILHIVNENHLNKVISFKELKMLVQKQNIDENNLKLCLHCLQCQKKVAVQNNYSVFNINNLNTDDILLKFSNGFNDYVEPINELDISTYQLEKNEKMLIDIIEKLEIDKENALRDTKTYISKGLRQMAKNSLRKKQALEKCIEKRSGVLENIQLLLSRIQEAECNSKVVDSFSKGVNAFKSTLNGAGLTEDNVNEVIDDVHEMLEMQDEIQKTLGENLNQVDESELEQELIDLLATDDSTTNTNNDRNNTMNTKNIEEQLNALNIELPSSPESKSTPKAAQFL